MDVEGNRLPHRQRRDILRQFIFCMFDCRISSIYSITSKGREILCKHKKRALAVFYLALEAVSVAMEQLENRVWVLTIGVFLLSAFVSTAVTYAHIKDRIAAKTKSQLERQFGVVEVVFSVLQLIATSINFIIRVLGIKISYTIPCLFPLAFSIMVVFFVFKNDENVNIHLASQKHNISSLEDLSTPRVNDVEVHVPETTIKSVDPSIQNSYGPSSSDMDVDLTEILNPANRSDNKLRHRYQGKQQALLKVSMSARKTRIKAMKLAATCSGVESVTIKGDDKMLMEVSGEKIDVVELITLLRNKIGYTDIISVGPVMAGVGGKGSVITRTGSI